jgi:hypothetical protein
MPDLNPTISSNSLILPFDQDEFGKFISGLLGKPQTIQAVIRGTFEISDQDIESTFHLVQQRVTQQNAATLVQFSVKIDYEDESSVLLNSLAAFRGHVEVRPLASVAAHLSWTYLITFHDKTVPEKQQIDLSFLASARGVVGEDQIYFELPARPLRSHIFLRISHTARTWGVDLEALLTGHVKSLFKVESKLGRLIYRNSGWVGIGSGALFYAASVVYAIRLTTSLIDAQALEVQRALADLPVDPRGVSQKLDLLIGSLAGNEWLSFANVVGLPVILFAFLAVIFGALMGGFADATSPRSFVLLSKKARESKEIDERKLRRRWFELASTTILGIVGGILSNLIYAWLIKPR